MALNRTSLQNQTIQVSSGKEAESKRYEDIYTFKWTVHDFNCAKAKKGENMPNIKFYFKLGGGMFFEGDLSIFGDKCENRKCCLELKNTTDKYWKVCCEIKINEDVLYSTHFTQDQSLNDFSLHDLSLGACLLKEDLNTVTCRIIHVTYKEVEQQLSIKLQNSSLQTDMEQIFESKAMSDVTFDVAEEEIQAHKLILASRSKYFANLFKESEDLVITNIVINDTEPKVFCELLRYIYTDKALRLTEMSKRLLIASQKFGVENLKLMCEQELAHKIDIETASELLILADENNAKHLKSHAIDFIKNHCKAVANTLGWQNIMNNKLHLLSELYIKIIE